MAQIFESCDTLSGDWDLIEGSDPSVSAGVWSFSSLSRNTQANDFQATNACEVLVKCRSLNVASEMGAAIRMFRDPSGSPRQFIWGAIGTGVLRIYKYDSSGGSASVASTAFSTTLGDWYWVRMQDAGTGFINVKAWKDGDAEPGSWGLIGINTNWLGTNLACGSFAQPYFGAPSGVVEVDQIGLADAGDTAPATAPPPTGTIEATDADDTAEFTGTFTPPPYLGTITATDDDDTGTAYGAIKWPANLHRQYVRRYFVDVIDAAGTVTRIPASSIQARLSVGYAYLSAVIPNVSKWADALADATQVRFSGAWVDQFSEQIFTAPIATALKNDVTSDVGGVNNSATIRALGLVTEPVIFPGTIELSGVSYRRGLTTRCMHADLVFPGSTVDSGAGSYTVQSMAINIGDSHTVEVTG